MKVKRIIVVAVGAAIMIAIGASARATATPTPPVCDGMANDCPTTKPPVNVSIYLENNNGNPGTVTATCGPNGPLLHTALFNDSAKKDVTHVTETARIYREDTGDVVFGPVDIPYGGHADVTMPYLAGVAFNAYAIPKGDPWPTTAADANARLAAKPPTADNSQLFPSGYPAAPDCPTPTPSPSMSSSSTAPSTAATTSVTTAPTTPRTVTSPTASATPHVPVLAHTGASALPIGIGAGVLLVVGTGAVVYARKQERGEHHE